MSLSKANIFALFVYAISAIGVAASAGNGPSICMNSPVATISAGQSITASDQNPQSRPCLATLVFSNDDFLPVTVEFPTIACLGYQQAEFSIPLEVPNGNVGILWGEVESCSSAFVVEGLADVNGLILEQTGFVECLVPTATQTTLATFTSFSTTEVDAIVTTLFSTSTATATALVKTTSNSVQTTATQTTQYTSQETTTFPSIYSTQNTTQQTVGPFTTLKNEMNTTRDGIIIMPAFSIAETSSSSASDSVEGSDEK